MRPALFWNILSTEARKRMSYRADFWINSIGGIAVSFSVYWFLAQAMFAASGQPTIGGYSPRGLVMYYVFAILIGRIVQSNDMQTGIPEDIYQGSLTRYLLYPVSYRAVKYAEQIGSLAPQMLQLAVFGLLAPWAFGIPAEMHITPASVAMALVSMALANLLNFLICFPIQGVAFWADNVWSLLVAERFVISLLGGMMLPLDFFPDWARAVLAWLPFPYLFSAPVRTLTGKVGLGEWMMGLAISAAWCGVASLVGNLVWRRGDLQYTGVGI